MFQVVSDNRMLIRHAYTGWPGSTHDARVLRHSSLYELGENSNKIAQNNTFWQTVHIPYENG